MNIEMEKDPGIIPQVLSQILDTCVNGITLSDPDLPDNPIVYANQIFLKITGYSENEVIGRNCRFMQGKDTEPELLERIRKALDSRTPVEVTLTNYRKNGSRFLNQLTIRPLFDKSGRLIYFLGIQYDVTEIDSAQKEIRQLGSQLGFTNDSRF